MRHYLILAVTALFLVFPSSVFSGTIVINEFSAVTAGTISDPDWVEIYNTGNETSLDGWLIRDLTDTNKIILSGCITAGGFRKFNFSNRLNNSGDQIRLFDQNGVLIDSLTYFSDMIPIHTFGQSTSRNPDASSLWQVFPLPTPTDTYCTASSDPITPPLPANPDLIQPAFIYNVSLSEFMANPPTGEKEWVEIFNPNQIEVDIGGWKIDDIEGASSPFTIPSGTKIEPSSYKVFSFSSKLNDSGDSVRLIRQDNEVENYTYKDAEDGYSYAKNASGEWQITTTPTPGYPNKITAPVEKISSSEKKTKTSRNTTSNTSNPFEQAFSDLQLESFFEPSFNESGEVAGISKETKQPPPKASWSMILLASGFSLIATAIVWPLSKYAKILKKL